jgi:uncharacterized membrane protein YfcA
LFAALMLVAAAAMPRRLRCAASGAPAPVIHLDWPLTGMFTLAALAALAGTPGGNRVAARVSAPKLTAAFAVLLVAVAAYTLSRTVPA